MNEREVLLNRIQVCDFALNDASLYLDSHPEDQVALRYYEKHLAMRKEAVEAFTSRYGPIARGDHDGGSRWKWVDDPWPWHLEEE